MLAAFAIGLLVSNTTLAVLGATGFLTVSRSRSLMITTGALVGIFSLVVGTVFLIGRGDALPDLQKIMGAQSATSVFAEQKTGYSWVSQTIARLSNFQLSNRQTV